MRRLRTAVCALAWAALLAPEPARADEDGRVAWSPAQVTAEAAVLPLPPDPGEAGKATLEGIDSDGDGLRDDVQRYIAATFPNSARVRAAAADYARTVQDTFFIGADQDAARRLANVIGRLADCMDFLLGSDSFEALQEAHRIKGRLRSKVLNTPDRIRAYFAYDAQLAGGIFSVPPKSEWKKGCAFNPDALPN